RHTCHVHLRHHPIAIFGRRAAVELPRLARHHHVHPRRGHLPYLTAHPARAHDVRIGRMNVGELIKAFLEEYQSETPELDVQLLLAHVTGQTRTWLFAHLDTPLTPSQLDSAQEAFAQLQAGTPLPYILGRWEFYGL